MTALVIGLGGAFGALSRYYVSHYVGRAFGESFPFGTLAVNVLGSFVLGFVLVLMHSRATSEHLRNLTTVGFLGSFTTFSTFSWETVELIRAGEVWRAGGYALGSLTAGVIAVLLGAALATAIEASS